MTQRNTGYVLILLLLAAIVMVPMVSAEKNMTGRTISATATKEQVDKINELWGKDITAGEYFQQIHPQLLVDMPDDIRVQLFKKKWIWPDSHELEIKTPANSLRRVPITCEGQLQSHPNYIHFAGMAQYSGGTPGYMAFSTYLVNSADQVKSSTTDSGYSVNYLNSDNYWQPDVSGSYHTHTTAFSLNPSYDAAPHYSTSVSWP